MEEAGLALFPMQQVHRVTLLPVSGRMQPHGDAVRDRQLPSGAGRLPRR